MPYGILATNNQMRHGYKKKQNNKMIRCKTNMNSNNDQTIYSAHRYIYNWDKKYSLVFDYVTICENLYFYDNWNWITIKDADQSLWQQWNDMTRYWCRNIDENSIYNAINFSAEISCNWIYS